MLLLLLCAFQTLVAEVNFPLQIKFSTSLKNNIVLSRRRKALMVGLEIG